MLINCRVMGSRPRYLKRTSDPIGDTVRLGPAVEGGPTTIDLCYEVNFQKYVNQLSRHGVTAEVPKANLGSDRRHGAVGSCCRGRPHYNRFVLRGKFSEVC